MLFGQRGFHQKVFRVAIHLLHCIDARESLEPELVMLKSWTTGSHDIIMFPFTDAQLHAQRVSTVFALIHYTVASNHLLPDLFSFYFSLFKRFNCPRCFRFSKQRKLFQKTKSLKTNPFSNNLSQQSSYINPLTLLTSQDRLLLFTSTTSPLRLPAHDIHPTLRSPVYDIHRTRWLSLP